MSSVNSTRIYDSYDADRAYAQDQHEREIQSLKEDEEQNIQETKAEYNQRLKEIREQANDDVRRLKESSYDAQGRFVKLERDNLQEQQRIVDAYESALKKSEDLNKHQVKRSDQRMQEALKDANDHATERMSALKEQFTEESQVKRKEYDMGKKYVESLLEKERQHNSKTIGQVIRQSDADRQQTISEHKRMYEEYLKHDREKSRHALNEKEEEIKFLQHTDDPYKVSPEARKRIEETYRKRFDADLAEEKRIYAESTAELKALNQNFEKNMRDKYTTQYNEMSKDLRNKYRVENQGLTKGYRDLEARSELNQKVSDDRARDQSQRAYQKHSSEMAMHEQRTQERLKDQLDTYADSRNKMRDEHEGKQRDAEVAHSVQLNDTIREFEKKILDLKDNHDLEKAQTKMENDKKLRDQDRTAKRQLNERVKELESQLKQQESMFKEHDRLLTEHYEEEIDKLKRTNARITQAKS